MRVLVILGLPYCVLCSKLRRSERVFSLISNTCGAIEVTNCRFFKVAQLVRWSNINRWSLIRFPSSAAL